MISKEEFVARRIEANKGEGIVMLRWIGIIGAFVLACIPIGILMDHYNTPAWVQVVFVCVFCIFTIGNVVLLFRRFYSRVKKFGLGCPNCGRALVQTSARFAVNTGKCMWCKATILQF